MTRTAGAGLFPACCRERGQRAVPAIPAIPTASALPAIPAASAASALPVLPAAQAAVSARSRSATRLAKLSIVFTCLQEVHDVNVVAQG